MPRGVMLMVVVAGILAGWGPAPAQAPSGVIA
jgi:hypothetical protein